MTHHIVYATRIGNVWRVTTAALDGDIVEVARLANVDEVVTYALQHRYGTSALYDTLDVRIGGRIHPTPPGPAPTPFINTRGHQRGTRNRHPVEHDQTRKHRS